MGHHNIHYGGDQYALDGVWSPPTSAANFCEEDYVVTRYIAEFINSLSNLSYVFLALRHMYGPGSRGLFRPRHDFMSTSLLALGIGSFLYHASLRQTLLFVDDLSLILLLASMLHGVFTVRQGPSQRRQTTAAIAIPVGVYSAFYVWSGEIIYSVVAVWTMIALITLRSYHLFSRVQPSFSEAKVRDWKRRQYEAVFICVLGYVIWHVDLEFCAELRAYREGMGLPWAWGLELHGWWHLLTAIGADRFMKVVRDIHAEEGREKAE